MQPPAPLKTGWNYTLMYKNAIVTDPGRNQMITQIAREYAEQGKQVYIHVTQVEHGKNLWKLLENDAAWVCGKDTEKRRERVLTAFKTGMVQILISTLLGEGVDIPSMDVIVLASGGKSQVALIQRIGRVLRPSPGKTGADVIDFLDGSEWLREHTQERIERIQQVYGLENCEFEGGNNEW